MLVLTVFLDLLIDLDLYAGWIKFRHVRNVVGHHILRLSDDWLMLVVVLCVYLFVFLELLGCDDSLSRMLIWLVDLLVVNIGGGILLDLIRYEVRLRQ